LSVIGHTAEAYQVRVIKELFPNKTSAFSGPSNFRVTGATSVWDNHMSISVLQVGFTSGRANWTRLLAGWNIVITNDDQTNVRMLFKYGQEQLVHHHTSVDCSHLLDVCVATQLP